MFGTFSQISRKEMETEIIVKSRKKCEALGETAVTEKHFFI